MEPLKFLTQTVASHISEIAHLPVLVLLSFHGLIGMASIAADRSAILVYVYPVLKASLLIKAAFRRSRIVNIDGYMLQPQFSHMKDVASPKTHVGLRLP